MFISLNNMQVLSHKMPTQTPIYEVRQKSHNPEISLNIEYFLQLQNSNWFVCINNGSTTDDGVILLDFTTSVVTKSILA